MTYKLLSEDTLSGGYKLLPEEKKSPGINDRGGMLQNMAGAVLSGAGSIGATILTPVDIAARAVGIENDIIGRTDRRKAIDEALRTAGVDTDATSFGLTRAGTQIAGTLGAGGALAKGVEAVPFLAKNAAPLIEAIGSSGMRAGGLEGVKGFATRAAGGAITGGASAGMVDPSTAGTGVIIGGAAPGVIQAAGSLGSKIGTAIKGAPQSPEVTQAVKTATDLGYVIPPTQAKPTLGNRLLEGFAGKLTTAQNASAKNAEVTNSLAAKAIGLAPETKITPEVLNQVRKDASQAYEALASMPVRPAQSASPLLNRPALPEINPKDMVFDLRKARNDATAWYNSYARTADPESLAKAQAARGLATKLENGLEDYAASIGRNDLLPAMQEARTLIAKTHTIEKALNPSTGTVDARKLGAMLDKGKPLSGELKQAAEFANRFPKAAQTVEKMGSLPQTSPLDWAASGGLSAATGNPAALAAVLARPGARSLALSKLVQGRLSQPESNSKLIELLTSPEGQQLLAKTAPIAAQR